MAHFAKINEDNIVVDIIRVNDSDCGDLPFPDSEPIGQAFIASLGIDGVWVQTSYNNSFRKTYPFQGCKYLQEEDIFIFPQPYPSWTLDENFDWKPPVPQPGETYRWSEDDMAWLEVPAG